MPAIKSFLRFNSLFLLPHAEAVRLATGLSMYTGDFFSLGERGYNLERLFNLREGPGSADDTLPARLIETPRAAGEPETPAGPGDCRSAAGEEITAIQIKKKIVCWFHRW